MQPVTCLKTSQPTTASMLQLHLARPPQFLWRCLALQLQPLLRFPSMSCRPLPLDGQTYTGRVKPLSPRLRGTRARLHRIAEHPWMERNRSTRSDRRSSRRFGTQRPLLPTLPANPNQGPRGAALARLFLAARTARSSPVLTPVSEPAFRASRARRHASAASTAGAAAAAALLHTQQCQFDATSGSSSPPQQHR